MKLLLLFQHWSVVGNETLASNSCFCCLWSELNSVCECLGGIMEDIVAVHISRFHAYGLVKMQCPGH